jgi:PCI domain
VSACVGPLLSPCRPSGLQKVAAVSMARANWPVQRPLLVVIHISLQHQTCATVQVLLTKVIGPYNCMRIGFLASKINCSEAEVERLLASLIVDGRIEGHIDQVKQLLLLPKGGSRGGRVDEVGGRTAAMDKWIATLRSMQRTLLQRDSL